MANQFITVSKLLRQAKIVLDLLYSICLPLWTNTLTIPWQQRETTHQKWQEIHTSLQTTKIT